MGQDAEVELRVVKCGFGRLVIKANKLRTRVCGGRDSRSRLTDNASPERAIAGNTIKKKRAMIVSVAANNGLLRV